jgi:hypothetical protein
MTSRPAPPTYTSESWTADTVLSNLRADLPPFSRLFLYLCVNDETGALVHAEYACHADYLAEFIRHAIAVQGQRVPSRLTLDPGKQRWVAEFAPLDLIQLAAPPYHPSVGCRVERFALVIRDRFEGALLATPDHPDLRSVVDLNTALRAWLRRSPLLGPPASAAAAAVDLASPLPCGEGYRRSRGGGPHAH